MSRGRFCAQGALQRSWRHPNQGTLKLGSSTPRYPRGVWQKSIKSPSVLSVLELSLSFLGFLNCAGISESHKGNTWPFI